MNKPTQEEIHLLHNELCSALNDETRVAIIFELAGGPVNVTGLAGALGIPQTTVSRHLKMLRERGVISGTRKRNEIHYELNDQRILIVLNILREILADSLKRRIETAARISISKDEPGGGLDNEAII